MLDIIAHNPYRYLGVYSNSPTKERVANQAKMNTFLKVGRQVSFPLDMSDLLGPINRTSENVADALAKLTLPADQIKYAQFWWMKATHIDNIAYNHLLKGDVDMAKAIWEVKEDASSLQNRIVLSLVQSDYASAIGYAQTLYNNYAPSFVASIMETGVSLDGTAFIHNFIDALIEESFDISQLQNLISDNEWIAYLSEKTVVPLIDRIDQAITIAQTSKGKGPKARYEAGLKLMESTKNSLSKLKSFISVTDFRYETVADKLGLEILQCGIDYYNNTDDNEATYNSMKLQSYALSIVVGTLAKERCQENVDILRKTTSELPPVEVIKEYHSIMEHIRNYRKQPEKIVYAIDLLRSTKSYLCSMKEKMGATNENYLKLSTSIVSIALNNIIKNINSLIIYKGVTNDPKAIFQAWSAIKLMDEFDKEKDFNEKRYTGNRSTLKKMYWNVGVRSSLYSKNGCITIIFIFVIITCISSSYFHNFSAGIGFSLILFFISMGIFSLIFHDD